MLLIHTWILYIIIQKINNIPLKPREIYNTVKILYTIQRKEDKQGNVISKQSIHVWLNPPKNENGEGEGSERAKRRRKKEEINGYFLENFIRTLPTFWVRGHQSISHFTETYV